MITQTPSGWRYVGKCWECNASIYYNEDEDKYKINSNLPDHQCRWGNEDED